MLSYKNVIEEGSKFLIEQSVYKKKFYIGIWYVEWAHVLSGVGGYCPAIGLAMLNHTNFLTKPVEKLFTRRVTSALSFIQCIARLMRPGDMIIVCHSYNVMWMIGKRYTKLFYPSHRFICHHGNQAPTFCTDAQQWTIWW